MSLSDTSARGNSEAGGDTDCSLSGLSALIFTPDTAEEVMEDEEAAGAVY